MLDLLWCVLALPLLGFLLLGLFGRLLPARGVAVIGVGCIAGAALVAAIVAATFLSAPAGERLFRQELWSWMAVGSLRPGIGLYLDPLSLVMMLVVTWVGFFIHLYAAEYMAGEEGYSRFFAHMNLFVASMLTLVLADNFVLLYLGWEGVGLCSYLLIGFWYRDPANGLAARKAFVVTRVGDTSFSIALFLLFAVFGTLDIQETMARATASAQAGSALAAAVALLLLGGAVGKSAQLPLQTWLPDAMAGPTPVSALIHAATMVTAGVYLIARTQVLYTMAPAVLLLVGIVGAVTMLMAGVSALVQHDIKRVLAYSTISQVGLMFLALGVGAYAAAIFHLVTHAFFKALLFLSAGVVIHALEGEQDIRKMGGLRRVLPSAFWPFLIGGCSLAGLPILTAGFYSKELILSRAFSAGAGGMLLGVAGLVGALLTALYIFRLLFFVFWGETRGSVHGQPGGAMLVSLAVLAVGAVAVGVANLPQREDSTRFLGSGAHTGATPLALQLVGSAVPLAGIALAYLWFGRGRRVVVRAGPWETLRRFWREDWGFDRLYDTAFVRPYVALARASRGDLFDLFFRGIAAFLRLLHLGLRQSQTGLLRTYLAAVAIGALILLSLVVLS